MISLKDSVCRKQNIPWRLIEEEAVLVDVKKGEVIHCNRVAAFIWSQIEGSRKVVDLIEKVLENFEIDEETALKDTIEFLNEIEAKGLVLKG